MGEDNDDFLSDIDNAVDNGGVVDTPEPVTNDVTGSPQKKSATKSVEENVLDLMGDDEEVDLLKGIAPKKEETPQQQREKLSLPTKKVEEKVEAQGKATSQGANQGQFGALDVFLKEDDKGNLLLADGTVVAMAGKSRAHFEAVKKAGRDAREQSARLAHSSMELATKFQSLYKDYSDVKDGGRAHLARSIGMTEPEVNDAISLMTQYKTDPVGAIKRLLTQAHLSGINLKDVGINSAPDAATVTSAVKAQLQEILGPLAQQRQESEADSAAVKEATAFLQEMPEAMNYVPAIEKAKAQFPQMSYWEIWARLVPHIQPRDPGNVQQDPSKSNTAVTTDVTQSEPQQMQHLQRQPGQRPYRAAQTTTPPSDYATMSYDQIAAQLLKEASRT